MVIFMTVEEYLRPARLIQLIQMANFEVQKKHEQKYLKKLI